MRVALLPVVVVVSAVLFAACSSRPIGPGGLGCLASGDACAVYSDCCSLECNAGVCVGNGACLPPGDACAGNPDCCNNACVGGFCAACFGGGEGCADNAECCSGHCNPMHVCMP